MPDITITVPPAAVPRIKSALRMHFPSGIDPQTGQPYPEPSDAEFLAQLKENIKSFVKREVTDYESRKAEEQARASITNIDIS